MNTLVAYKTLTQQKSIFKLLNQCKQLARDVKNQRPHPRWLHSRIRETLPGATVVEELINLYFATYESCYRILHYHSFYADYRHYLGQSDDSNSSFFLILVLIISAAGILHDDADVRLDIAAKVPVWIDLCQGWLSAPLEKDRLTLRGIQISCLLLLVRQVNRIGSDLVWISTGSLLRMAMQMGLHQDPSSLAEDMDRSQAEMRRRLWYTILEMNIQTALDAGMSPMIAESDWTTQSPSVLSDTDLQPAQSPNQSEHIPAGPERALFQHALSQSITLRLEATKVINSLQEEPSYDEVLLLDTKLTTAFRHAVKILKDGDTTGGISKAANQFALDFFNHLFRRYLLCLHFPYAIKTQQVPTYAHSQKMCLEITQDLVSLLSDGIYGRVLINGGGMFRDIITRGGLVLYLALNSELEDIGASSLGRQRGRHRQMMLMEDFRQVLQYSKHRLYQGSETSTKGFFFLSIASAQLEAHLQGDNVEDAMAKAARGSLDTCHDVLRMKLDNSRAKTLPSPIPWAVQDVESPSMSIDFGIDLIGGENLSYPNIFQSWADDVLGGAEAFSYV